MKTQEIYKYLILNELDREDDIKRKTIDSFFDNIDNWLRALNTSGDIDRLGEVIHRHISDIIFKFNDIDDCNDALRALSEAAVILKNIQESDNITDAVILAKANELRGKRYEHENDILSILNNF